MFEALLSFLVAVGGFYFIPVKGPKLFVRAHIFLVHLDNGSSVEEANKAAQAFGNRHTTPENDARHIQAAYQFARESFGGQQAPVIALARRKGFSG